MLVNDPVDLRGRPFPTRYWLACRALVEAISRLEADGGVRALESDPSIAAHLVAANARHRERHAGFNVGGTGDPSRVKCLHAHLAFAMASGGSHLQDESNIGQRLSSSCSKSASRQMTSWFWSKYR